MALEAEPTNGFDPANKDPFVRDARQDVDEFREALGRVLAEDKVHPAGVDALERLGMAGVVDIGTRRAQREAAERRAKARRAHNRNQALKLTASAVAAGALVFGVAEGLGAIGERETGQYTYTGDQTYVAGEGDVLNQVILNNVEGANNGADISVTEVASHVIHDPRNQEVFANPDGTFSGSNLGIGDQIWLPEEVTLGD